MRKVRIAQIGINQYSHATAILETINALDDIFEFVGYTLVEDERETCADKINKFYKGYPEMTLEEILCDPTIEAVTVETDEIHLLKYAIMAAKAGKHIHMEKPGSQSLSDFEELISIMKKSGKIFSVGYMYRYNPYVREVAEKVKRGELGHVFSVEAHMSRMDDKVTREWFSTFKGGMMFYLGCHIVDLIMEIQGVPTEVIPLNTVTGIDGIESEDFGFAVLKYPGAVSFARVSATELGGGYRRQLVVCAEKGTVEICPIEAPAGGAHMLKAGKRECFFSDTKNNTGVFSRNFEAFETEPFQRYMDMMKAFASMVRGDMENPRTYDYELCVFKTLLKCCGFEI